MNEAAHTFEWKTDKLPAAGEAGAKHEECAVCGYAKPAVETAAVKNEKPAVETAAVKNEKPAVETAVVKNEQQLSESEDKTDSDASPQTGDNDNTVCWFLLILSAGVILCKKGSTL